MGKVYKFPINNTKVYKWANKFVNFVEKGEPYEASIYASMTIPDQLKGQVQIIVNELLDNIKKNRKE